MQTVVFEGANKVGKSTLMAAFNKATDYKYCCIDRAHVSTAVYAHLRKIPAGASASPVNVTPEEVADLIDLAATLGAFGDTLTIVHVKCKESVRMDRLAASDGESPAHEASIFESYIHMAADLCPALSVIEVDTSAASIEACVENIKLSIEVG